MSARAAIFARLRAAGPVPPIPAPDLTAYYRDSAAAGETPGQRSTRFIARAQSWKAEVIECRERDWTQALREVCARKNLRRVLAGAQTEISEALGATLPPEQLQWYERDIEAFKAELFADYGAGITTVRSGIAETGSLILWATPQEPRTLSLVPPVHIAVCRASRLHERLYDAMQAEHWAEGLPANAFLVSGPSKTADIQRILAYGAHGPKELVILLVRDDVDGAGHAG